MLVQVPLSSHFLCSPGSWAGANSSLWHIPCWFESHYRRIPLCSPGSWARVRSSLQKETVGLSPTIGIFLYVAQAVECVLPVVSGKKTMLVRIPYLHFLYVSIGLKTFTKGIVELVSMTCVLGTHGGFVLALFKGGLGEWNTVGKCAALISAFETSW